MLVGAGPSPRPQGLGQTGSALPHGSLRRGWTVPAAPRLRRLSTGFAGLGVLRSNISPSALITDSRPGRYTVWLFGKQAGVGYLFAKHSGSVASSEQCRSGFSREVAYLVGMQAGVGVLVCEAFRERSEQRANKYPAAVCRTRRGSRCKQCSYRTALEMAHHSPVTPISAEPGITT